MLLVLWSTRPSPRKGRPRQTPSNFVTTRAHSYKISFGLIPSYVRCGRRGAGGGWRRGQLQRSQSPGGQMSTRAA